MIEINEETANDIIRGLNIFNNFANVVNSDVDINLKSLSLCAYDYDIEEWIFGIIKTLFTSGIEIISNNLVTNINEICDILKKYDTHVASQVYADFLASYGYNSECDESLLENEQFEEDFENYYLNYDIKRVEFSTPLIKNNDGIYYSFLSHVPALVEHSLGLNSHVLLDIDTIYNKTYNKYTIVMHVAFDCNADFSDDLYIPALIDDFEELLRNFYIDLY